MDITDIDDRWDNFMKEADTLPINPPIKIPQPKKRRRLLEL